MNRRAILMLPLLGPVLTPTVAVAAAPNWQAAVAALAGGPDEKSAAAYQSDAAAHLAGVQDPAAQALIATVAKNARESYADDGGRFLSIAAGARTFDGNSDLLAWLLDEPAPPVDALTDLLRAGRMAANVAVGDLAAAVGQRGADPDLTVNAWRREALLHGRTAVRTGSDLVRSADQALRNVLAGAAFAQWTAAWTLSSEALTQIGTVAPLQGEDPTACRKPSHRRGPHR